MEFLITAGMAFSCNHDFLNRIVYYYSFTATILQKRPQNYARIGEGTRTRPENVGSNTENPYGESQFFHHFFHRLFISNSKFSLFQYYRYVALMNHFLIILIILFRSKSILNSSYFQ